jgi:hypothetical protein
LNAASSRPSPGSRPLERRQSIAIRPLRLDEFEREVDRLA